MLKLCEADPVDLLIDLGFGIDEPDLCTKIPTRFIITPSEARGINFRVFLEAQKQRMEIENPNLCGRFRQLEVLEQVTSAFSSLLRDVHTIKNGEDQKEKSVKTSTLTQEKRKRIRQLLWKFSKQVKIVDESPSPCINAAELNENQDNQEPIKDTSNLKVFLKRLHSTDENSLAALSKDQLPAEDRGDELSQRPENQLCILATPVKQYSLPDMPGKARTLMVSKVLSRALKKKSARHRLQTPESFEIEEVQSFEEDYPRAITQDSMSEITRTNSCQSDSSGFQEEPPELLPLQNTDHDMENMKKSCQHYREKLIDIEQRLIEQQAGCFNIFTSEEREKMRTLHLLRRNVLKEALELELNLDEQARHAKETISLQLKQVLEEQSRLYSELELCNWDQDMSPVAHCSNILETHNSQPMSSPTINVPKEDPELNQAQHSTPSQKMDFSTILQNIKKTFRSFNSS